MADSDDEYDRKRRDKFRGERGSGDSYRSERREDRRGGGGGGPGAGGEWPERNPFRGAASAAGGGAGGGAAAGGGRGRPEYFDYRQRFGSPSRERPPAKRMRGDWGDDLRPGPRYGGYDPYLMHAWNEHYAAHSMHAPYAPHPLGHPGAGHGREPPAIMNSDIPTQPPMLTLKQFLEGQDDSISDSEVLNKYAEYKLDFKRTQLNEFFVTHKDAEWFKNKYHPLESSNRRQEHLQYLKNRITVFNELLDNGQIGSVSVDTSQTDPLLRLLDTVVIKLEGGTDEDLKILDEKPKEIVFPEKKIERDDDVIITSVEKQKPAAKDKPEVEVVPRLVSPPPIKRAAPQSDEENWDDDDEPAAVVPKPAEPATSEPEDTEKKPKSKKSLKRKRSHSDSSSSSSNSDSESSSSSSSDDDDDEKVKNYDLESLKKEDDEDEEEKSEPAKVENENSETNLLDEKSNESARAAANDTPTEDEVKPPASPLNDDEESKTDSKPAVDDEDKNDDEPMAADEAAAVTSIKKEADADGPVAIDDDDEAKPDAAEKKVEEPETIDLDTVKDGPQPRPLHRTSSIFLRNLAPHITKAEIEALCTRYDGYLRVAIADPLPERRWYRRGWVTFKRDVNIKEICWNLNNTRIKDCEMGAIVNRDLSRRVRPVNGLTAHKSVVRADIKLCAKLTMLLDEKFKLWMQNNEENHSETTNGNGDSGSASSGSAGQSYGFNSKNPVLQNITDFLIEEASAEEEELLGITNETKEGDGEVIERDPQLISVLDRLILYLRIIHSVDFYNHCEYPYEDEMPNRCGIIHARGPPPSKITQNDIQDYIKNFENKMQTFLAKPQVIEESELKKLGAKDAEEEVEKFIQANTQELAKDKWLCPLSGKKFKGPEFIRKHIFNKHGEKVEEVRKEVEFFNNYLKDPKRPQLPEHPGNTKRTISESSGGGGGFRPPVYPPAYAPPYAAYLPPMMMPGRGRGFGGGVGRRELPMDHQRRIIGYHDLDAPSNFDMFD